MPPDPADANGDVPMTEQMTGRKGPEGTERPGAATPPLAPSPRDLAARSPHHPAARVIMSVSHGLPDAAKLRSVPGAASSIGRAADS